MIGWRHIFLVTDIEGVAGVDSWDQTRVGARHEAAKALATAEINCFLKALLGPEARQNPNAPRVSLWDGHGCGGLLHDRIDQRVTLYRHDDVRGFPGLLRAALGETPPLDALAFIGQHAMEGSGGTLSHTFSSRRIKSYTLNGRPIGEFDLRALYAWALSAIPTILVSGDDVACREARKLVPGIVSVEVKQSLGITSARHLDVEMVHTGLAAAADKILEQDPSDPSLRLANVPASPWELRKHFKPKFGFIPRPPRTLRGNSLVDLLENE